MNVLQAIFHLSVLSQQFSCTVCLLYVSPYRRYNWMSCDFYCVYCMNVFRLPHSWHEGLLQAGICCIMLLSLWHTRFHSPSIDVGVLSSDTSKVFVCVCVWECVCARACDYYKSKGCSASVSEEKCVGVLCEGSCNGAERKRVSVKDAKSLRFILSILHPSPRSLLPSLSEFSDAICVAASDVVQRRFLIPTTIASAAEPWWLNYKSLWLMHVCKLPAL